MVKKKKKKIVKKKKIKKVVKKKKKKVAKKKVVKKKKSVKKRVVKKKVKAAAKNKEKVIGNIEHFFGKINVAALKLKSPLSVGDTIHIVGPHNDFCQRIDSIQINHKDVEKAKKGEDIGFKVKQKVRVTDTVYLAAKEERVSAQPVKPMMAIQKPMFPSSIPPRPMNRTASKPTFSPKINKPKANPKPMPKSAKKSGYGDTKFLSF
jgi:hypothetical protein